MRATALGNCLARSESVLRICSDVRPPVSHSLGRKSISATPTGTSFSFTYFLRFSSVRPLSPPSYHVLSVDDEEGEEDDDVARPYFAAAAAALARPSVTPARPPARPDTDWRLRDPLEETPRGHYKQLLVRLNIVFNLFNRISS